MWGGVLTNDPMMGTIMTLPVGTHSHSQARKLAWFESIN